MTPQELAAWCVAVTDSKPHVGTCSKCRHATRVNLDDVQRYDLSTRLTDSGVRVDTTRPFKGGNGPVCAKCPDHGVYQLAAIKGHYSPDHECDARCAGATGPQCDCSCGGANHGTAHAA